MPQLISVVSSVVENMKLKIDLYLIGNRSAVSNPRMGHWTFWSSREYLHIRLANIRNMKSWTLNDILQVDKYFKTLMIFQNALWKPYNLNDNSSVCETIGSKTGRLNSFFECNRVIFDNKPDFHNKLYKTSELHPEPSYRTLFQITYLLDIWSAKLS